MSATATMPTPTQPVDITSMAVFMTLNFESMGNSRKLPEGSVKTTGKQERFRASKKLLESEELADIRSHYGMIKKYVKARSLPSFEGKAIYLIPKTKYTDIENNLRVYRDALGPLLDKFVAAYESLVAAAKIDLKDHFDASDYPAVGEVRNLFGIQWRFVNFGVPDSLQEISPELFEAEKEKHAKKLSDATENITQYLRASMSELVNHLVDKLTGTREGGKKKIFKDATITNMREFLDTFNDLNITKDAELEAITVKAKALLEGVDPDSIRKDEGTRDMVVSGFTKVKEGLDALLVDKPARSAMLFGDDDESL